MSYKLNYLEDSNIVRVIIKGRLNFGTVQQYSTEAINLAHKNKCSKYLFDHTETIPETDVFKLHTDGDTLEQFGFKSNDNIAVVIAQNPSAEQYIQTARSNVKWSNTRYFRSAAEAMKWLEEEAE